MHKGRFLERNRITSGLSEGVVVVETGKSGGSIRQAETAFRQGRPVYVLKPDGSSATAAAGYQHLVSCGAIPVESPTTSPVRCENAPPALTSDNARGFW